MILFLVTAASSYRLQRQVARRLARTGASVGFLYERDEDAVFALIQKDAADLGATAVALESLFETGRESGAVLRRHPRLYHAVALWFRAHLMKPGRVQSMLRRLLPGGLFRRVVLLDADAEEIASLGALRSLLAARLDAAKRALTRFRPAIIVACEDGVSAPLPVHAVARHEAIPVVILPYGYGVRSDFDIVLEGKEARGEVMRAEGCWLRLLTRHAPQWVKQGAHAGALMHSGPYIVAAESLGITLRDSWTVHGGYADRVYVESEQMRRVYLDEGLPQSKLVLTGTPYCDVMTDALGRNPDARAALRQPRRITPGLMRVLVSWPPSYHADRGAFSEFATYREMTRATLGWLCSLASCQVTVSLHPATLPADRSAVIDTGVSLATEYVVELIPQHDLFVTYFSSTIRWAVAAGKPVVNFDLYRLGLQVYDAAPGVITVSTLDDFKRAMMRLAASEDAFAETAARPKPHALRGGLRRLGG